jgi:hypothetical protein
VRDVDVPQQAPKGVRGLIVHALTVMFGLLMALGLEKVVEWRHHVSLAHDADAAMTDELRRDADSIHAMEESVAAQQRWATVVLAALDAPPGEAHPEVEPLGKVMGYWPPIQNARWELAKATNALAYMESSRAAAFASVYSVLSLFMECKDTAMKARVSLFLVDRQIAKLRAGEPLSPAEVDRVRDEVRRFSLDLHMVSDGGRVLEEGIGYQPTPPGSNSGAAKRAAATPHCRDGSWLRRKVCTIVRGERSTTASIAGAH